jgi:hypothetical protein
MSSRVFKATTGHSDANPQLCGLTGTPIQKDDWCFYLVCKGDKARPDYQISVVREEEKTGRRGKKYTKKIRETPDGQPFFSVFTGEWETYEKRDGSTGRRRVYEWQTEDPVTGARIPVLVWSNMVLASSADKLGYRVPKTKNGKYITTKAHQGDRTVGFEHRQGEEEPAMVTIAKAALSDEDAGVVAPKDEGEDTPSSDADTAQDAGPDEETELAAALGLTVEQYRKLQED